MNDLDKFYDFDDDLVKDKKDFFEKYSQDSFNRPKILYHYTTEKGIKGIIETGCFWATHFRFLDDKTEILHGVKLIEHEFKKFVCELKNTGLKKILKKQIDIRNRWLNAYNGFNHNVYIVSFTEEYKSTHLWKNYGSKGKGFVIGIEPNELLKLRMDLPLDNVTDSSRHFWLVKIEYKESKQREIIREFLRNFENKIPDSNCFRNANERNTFYQNAANEYLIYFTQVSELRNASGINSINI